MRRRLVTAVVALALLGSGVACAGATQPEPVAPSPTRTLTVAPARSRPAVRPPPANAQVDYQLGGAYAPARSVRVVTRDRRDPPAAGTYGICYVNAFQTQPEESGFWTRRHPDLLLRSRGRPVGDPDWPGEFLLDTSTAAKRTALAEIIGGWIDDCHRAGYAAVEPDNLDSWTRSKGRLTRRDNLAYARVLAARAHRVGLAFGQKNAAELTRAQRRRVAFDFAVAEECQVYGECAAYTRAYGDRVIEIEYTDHPRRFYTAACAARGRRISVILRDRDVVPRGRPGYHYEAC